MWSLYGVRRRRSSRKYGDGAENGTSRRGCKIHKPPKKPTCLVTGVGEKGRSLLRVNHVAPTTPGKLLISLHPRSPTGPIAVASGQVLRDERSHGSAGRLVTLSSDVSKPHA
ncbi:ras-related protein Rab-11A [Platysternon megacephalum]|uniref:Ras-related protein Rab-11A n=1 Tax=Platysternon megacephalum TaxID=55544 RepID=A0A4D9F5J9_9SAUR|nr:ras-related protein Rab-11A [Platysternon megacephalum]